MTGGAISQNGGVLRVVGPAALNAAEAQADQENANSRQSKADEDLSGLAAYIRSQFDMMKRHRNTAGAGWTDRLLNAMRVFNGQYDPGKLAEIKKFGGSDVYARMIAMKCRGTSSLLRDVYLSADRPWGLDAPDDPEIPTNILQAIRKLVQTEVQTLQQGGGQLNPDMIADRGRQLLEAARNAAKKKARDQARIAEDKIDEMLKEGGFYKALAEFLVDVPLFPFACIKGPEVRMVPTVTWQNGKPQSITRPRLFWSRVSPFDLWWTPGVADIEDASVIERGRVTRADLNDLLDLPGYNADAIRSVLDEYGRGGLNEDWDVSDTERAVQESRENPRFNRSGMISVLQFTGNIQGRMLVEYGMDMDTVPDLLRDYYTQAWLIGRHVIKAQLAPSPRKRHPYFITSFEKVPGTPVGNALPDVLSDIEEVSNATLRALVNNMSISSGPQVVINNDRIGAGADAESLYPWKRWFMTSNPMGGNSTDKPVEFFQPQSNAQELLTVYQAFATMADELSAIPKYMSGSGPGGGAGRTASGLAMLMGNASKILQTVAANIDRDVIDPCLSELFDMIMLTDSSGLLTGEEKVRVQGVAVAVQRETQRQRQMEFLQATANPMDMQIIGPKGRASVLRAVSTNLGMPGEEIVPSQEEIEAQQKAAQQMAAQQGVPGHAGLGPQAAKAQGAQPSESNQDTGPRTSIAGGSQ